MVIFKYMGYSNVYAPWVNRMFKDINKEAIIAIATPILHGYDYKNHYFLSNIVTGKKRLGFIFVKHLNKK